MYSHLMVPTGKRYIGMTGQALKRRFQRGSGYEKNPAFYADIQEYGWDSVETEVLAETEDFELACCFEKAAMERWKTTDEAHGYNLWSSGEDNIPIPSVGKNISKAKMGHEVTTEVREKLKHHNCRAVIQMDMLGKPLKIHESLSEAARSVNVDKSNIYNAVNGVRPTSRGYKWCYLDKYEEVHGDEEILAIKNEYLTALESL